MNSNFPTICICIIFSVVLHRTVGIAVMSVDFGSEWMKLAIVSPGVPMEIALNKESKRKTPVAISFRNNEREIGESAVTVGVRFPDSTYTNLLDLLGKKLDNPMVDYYKKHFPYHQLAADLELGTVVFDKNNNSYFSVEELISMILCRARELAEDFAGQSIKDMVITVPAFFNQAERRSLLRAAELAKIKVLQLINDNTAVALNYGVFRRKDFNTTAQNIMFYDMGASSTKATIVAYQLVKTKEKGFVETNPQLTILGYGYDRTLGGTEFTLRLRDHLGKIFNEQKKTKNDVFSSPRAVAKLRKEAERVKMVLSANLDHIAQVENLLDEVDFKTPIQRTEFEDLCGDLFDRVGGPVSDALKQSAMTMDDIDQVILVGAGTRIPKVQERLLEAVKKPELGKNLNTDEAAALGAVYQAAHLSQGFKVKKFLIKDAVLYPIQVDFERELDAEDGTKGRKIVSRTLFGLLNPYPLKKVMTFNRLTKNEFDFNVNYGELKMSSHDKKIFGSVNISQVHLTGIQDAISKHITDGSEPKGVKAHFRLDDSGLLSLDLVESVFEIKEEVTEPELDMESAFSKLGSTISKLFSGSSDDEKLEKIDESSPEGEKESQELPPKEEQFKHVNATESTNITSGNQTQQQLNETGTEEKNATLAVNITEAINATKKTDTKPKITFVKEPISIKQEKLDLQEPSTEKFQLSMKRIVEFNDQEKKKRDKEEAKNNLESFILDTQDKLYQPEYEAASTDEDREKIRSEMSTLSDWLYEEGEEAEAEVYRSRLKELHEMSKDIFTRVKEHRDRPEALNALRDLINMSEVFLEKARALPEEEQYFTTVELDVLEKIIGETKTWKLEKEALQEKHPLTQMPKLTVRNIAEKLALLDREVKYLLNKARTSKPKVKKTKSDTPNKTSDEQEEPNSATPEDSETSSNSSETPEASGGQKEELEQEEITEEIPKQEAKEAGKASKTEEETTHTEL